MITPSAGRGHGPLFPEPSEIMTHYIRGTAKRQKVKAREQRGESPSLE